MQIETTPLAGLLLVSPKLFRDERGFFLESWNRARFAAEGIGPDFVQDNHSASVRGTLRGLHFQTEPGQGKLVRCTRGRIWDVAVDLREGSETFGKWHAVELDEFSHKQLWIPIGFAHGFCVLSEMAEVQYKCTNPYEVSTEAGIAWDDPEVKVGWPLELLGGGSAAGQPLLSQRDQSNPTLKQWLDSRGGRGL